MQLTKKPLASWSLVLWLSRLAALSIAMVFLLSHTVLAANWVYLQRLEGTRYGACTEYVDAASVIKAGEKMIYWTIWVLDGDEYRHAIKKILWKRETSLPGYPLQKRILEQYYFNAENQEIRRYLEPTKDYRDSDDEIKRVLGYAKEAAYDTARPDYIDVPKPKWYGVMNYDDFDLYWDIHSIVAWPQDNPTTIDVRVKKVWSQEAQERRKALLASLQKPYRQNYDGLTYTLVNYQFSINESLVRILGETDYDSRGHRMTVVDGSERKDFDCGSVEEAVRGIALHWVQDSTGR